MKSKDESIQMLKMRIQNHMNISSENVIRPENIQYYTSSLMMQREEMQQKENLRQKEDAQQDIHIDEEEAETVEKEDEEYIETPDDIEYIKGHSEIPPVLKDIKVPEQTEVQHERAKNGYEKVLHSEEDLFGYKEMHWLNIKG